MNKQYLAKFQDGPEYGSKRSPTPFKFAWRYKYKGKYYFGFSASLMGAKRNAVKEMNLFVPPEDKITVNDAEIAPAYPKP